MSRGTPRPPRHRRHAPSVVRCEALRQREVKVEQPPSALGETRLLVVRPAGRHTRVAAATLVRLRELLGAGCIVVGEEAPQGGERLTMAGHFAELDAAMAEGLANLG